MQAHHGTNDAVNQALAGDQAVPLHFEIRVRGYVDARWAAWFDGLTLTYDGDGTTVIGGPLADQAALHGLLQKLRDVAIPLVSVAQVRADR